MSAAEAATGKDTQFDDVKGTHWASGYVTVGTSSGSKFIDGYSDTEFGPEDNVTYAQAIKMLVGALGYTTYAENNGGWPNGYLSYGYSLDITKGITGVSNDTQVTRAQVAQMIDNAVKAPICVIDGYDTQWNGVQTPKLVEKNTPSTVYKDTWQCLLNYSHDAYIVKGRVRATHQSDNTIDTDEVRISIEKSDNYNGFQAYVDGNGVYQGSAVADTPAYIGESGADKYLLTYAEIIVQMDDDDELTILSIVPVGTNKTEVFNAEDLDDRTISSSTVSGTTKYSMVDSSIKVYVNGSTTKTTTYKLANQVEFYLNGMPLSKIGSTSEKLAEYINGYVKDNATGIVTLIDSPDDGKTSADGKYDYIMVTRYKDAIVDSVIGDDEVCTIYFSEVDTDMDTSLEVDTTNKDKYYSFEMADGTAVKASELQQDDVLSIAWPGTTAFGASDSYTVLVSRDTVEGKVSSKGSNDGAKTEFTVNGSTYKVASTNLVDSTNSKDIVVGNEYTFYLDAFGRVAKTSETASSQKIALLENVYKANGDQYYASIVTPNGDKTSYTIKDEKTYNEYRKYCFVLDGAGNVTEKKQDPQDRVWSYSISSSTNNISLKDKQTAYAASGNADAKAEYKESTNRIGSVRMNESLTSLLDLSDYYKTEKNESTGATEKTYVGTIEPMSFDALEDAAVYGAYGFNKLSDNSYQLVLVTEGGQGSLTYKTDFVIYSKQSSQEVDGDTKTAYTVYAPGATEPTELVWDTDPKDYGLNEGDPIIVQKDASGYIKEIYPLFQKEVLSSGYASFANNARNALKQGGDLYDKILNKSSFVSAEKAIGNKYNSPEYIADTTSSNKTGWIFGAVYDRSSGSVTVATEFEKYSRTDNDGKVIAASDYTTNVNNLKEYDFDPDANVLVYNYKERAGKQLRVSNGILSSILKLAAPKNAFLDEDKDTYLDWNSKELKVGVDPKNGGEGDQYGMTSFIFAKLVDNDIVEAYVIVPSSTRN